MHMPTGTIPLDVEPPDHAYGEWKRMSALDVAEAARPLGELDVYREWLTAALDRLGPPRAHNYPLPHVDGVEILDDVDALRPEGSGGHDDPEAEPS